MNEPRQLQILAVDDDPGLLRTLRRILASEGYSVSAAQDGEDGLQHVLTTGFDLVILDLQMPRMDGRTFFRELRARGYTVPVLVLSAYGAEAAAKELRAEFPDEGGWWSDLQEEADRLGISRQALIKVWIAERLERKAG